MFNVKMGMIKDRNGMDLTEAEEIKKSWQEHTEELYKEDLHDPDNHNGVITHLEPDILECKVKWALGSITMNKASGGNGITAQLFEILKDDAVKVLPAVCQQIWKTQQWLWDWKRLVFTPVPKKGNAEESSNYQTATATTTKSLQSCLTLCDPIDGSPPGFRPWDSPGKNTGVGCHFLLQCMKVKCESEATQSCPTQWHSFHMLAR